MMAGWMQWSSWKERRQLERAEVQRQVRQLEAGQKDKPLDMRTESCRSSLRKEWPGWAGGSCGGSCPTPLQNDRRFWKRKPKERGTSRWFVICCFANTKFIFSQEHWGLKLWTSINGSDRLSRNLTVSMKGCEDKWWADTKTAQMVRVGAGKYYN